MGNAQEDVIGRLTEVKYEQSLGRKFILNIIIHEFVKMLNILTIICLLNHAVSHLNLTITKKQHVKVKSILVSYSETFYNLASSNIPFSSEIRHNSEV